MIRTLLSCPLTRSCAGLLVCMVALVQAAPTRPVAAATIEVWYAPEDQPLEHVVRIYDRATRYIFVAVYGLTSPLAVKALVAAEKRGVDVRVIKDALQVRKESEQPANQKLFRNKLLALLRNRFGGHEVKYKK